MSTKITGYTVEQFKAWLDGIEEMQPKNWAPDAEQWKTIRKKINTLRDVTPTVTQSNITGQSPVVGNPNPTAIGHQSNHIPASDMIPMIVPSDFDGTIIVPGAPLVDPTFDVPYQSSFK